MNIMKKIILIIILLSIFVFGCTERIDYIEDPINDLETPIEGYSVFFDEGTAYYEITVNKPTPCNEVKVETKITDKLNLYVTIEDYDGMCAQVITEEIVKGELYVGEGVSGSEIYYNNKKVF